MPTCYVIIPTYNNEHTLPKTLAALKSQIIPENWQLEIIISDDGSTTPPLSNKGEDLGVQVVKNYHRGSASARNSGLEKIISNEKNIVILLGADIILRPNSITHHIQFHEHNTSSKDAALGFVVWDPRLPPSPLNEWMTHSGPQNNFDSLLGEKTCDTAKFFYASHLSVKAIALKHHRFSEKFSSYGWEDIELGIRLAENGIKLHPLPRAVGLHNHKYNPDSIAKRQRAVGSGSVLLQKIHPGKINLPNPGSTQKRIIRRTAIKLQIPWILLQIVYLLESKKISIPRIYAHFTGLNYWKGVAEGLKSERTPKQSKW